MIGVRSLSWRSRFPGLENPALYVEIERKEHDTPIRTKSKRGYDARWWEDLTLYALTTELAMYKAHCTLCSPEIEKDQTLRFRLKVVMPLISDRIVGEAEWKVTRPLGKAPPYYQKGKYLPIDGATY